MGVCQLLPHQVFFFLTEWESSSPLPVNDMRWSLLFPTAVVVETMSHTRWSPEIPGCDPNMQQPQSGESTFLLCFSLPLSARAYSWLHGKPEQAG